jgi:hypothetical protein
MHVILIIIGLILVVFGGGCTLIVGGLVLADPGSLINDPMEVLSLGGGMGLLPLAIGIALFRWGLRIDREKRNAARTNLPPPDTPA